MARLAARLVVPYTGSSLPSAPRRLSSSKRSELESLPSSSSSTSPRLHTSSSTLRRTTDASASGQNLTDLRSAAELGTAAIAGGSLMGFEKACDDAVTATVAQAKRVPFGIEPVVGYLAAKEIEFTAVRVILTGRMAGLNGEAIRERLRETYV